MEKFEEGENPLSNTILENVLSFFEYFYGYSQVPFILWSLHFIQVLKMLFFLLFDYRFPFTWKQNKVKNQDLCSERIIQINSEEKVICIHAIKILWTNAELLLFFLLWFELEIRVINTFLRFLHHNHRCILFDYPGTGISTSNYNQKNNKRSFFLPPVNMSRFKR